MTINSLLPSPLPPIPCLVVGRNSAEGPETRSSPHQPDKWVSITSSVERSPHKTCLTASGRPRRSGHHQPGNESPYRSTHRCQSRLVHFEAANLMRQ